MENAVISVIIPVYNVEQYLDRCVQSVIHQSLEKLQILLIDDGSPDGCPQMCDQYAQQDSRIRVIHKKNGGLASARNAGLKAATGSYAFFLDSDDWLDLNGLELLYQTALKYDVDFVRYRAIRSYWPGLEEHAPGRVEQIREMPGGYYDYERIKAEIYPRLIATNQLTMGPVVAAWSSLYQTDFLKKNGLHFDEQVRYSEDMIFSAKVLLCAKRFYYIDTACVYHYFYNASSISKSFRAERWISCKHLIELFERDFSDTSQFDFTDQFVFLRWFCIMLGLNERKHINERKQREEYCKSIVNDPVVKKTELAWMKMDVTAKQKVLMLLVKMRLSGIIQKL